MKKQRVAILAVTIFATACASKNKSIGAGGLIGATVGAGIGVTIPGQSGTERARNIIIGSAIGGTAGVLMGAAAYKNEFKQYEYQKKAPNYPLDPPIPPSLKKAKVESRWIESKIIGNRYISGHWEFVILEPASFEER